MQPFNQEQPQQPYGQYPQQQPHYQPQQQPVMPPPVPQKKKPWYRSPIGCGILIVVLLACGLIGVISTAHGTPFGTPDTATIATTQPASNPTTASQKPSPTHALTWKTTHTFTGNGNKKTGTFTAVSDWKIVWSCNHTSFNGYDYNVIVFVYGTDGNLVDSGVNSTCKKNYTHDATEVHTGGQVYLDITSEGDWTIQVQELQ